MTVQEIRKQFLDHFAERGHRIVPSAPIVVKNDPTLMFTNAGMNPFKDLFLGNKQATDKRITDTQKCLRVSGKHNDLEEVGRDTYHHTMFEMLGNWSFGDYFKQEAIQWAWELLVDTYKIDKERMYVTYFGGDKEDGLEADLETRDLWSKYLPMERILPYGKKDNFWEMGDSGPCGPCSEIHVDIRTDEERSAIAGDTLVNNDHPQVIEIWNLVFIQFDRKADGKLTSLPAKHVDTGMGLERLCMVLQGERSNYDTDVFMPIIQMIEKASGIVYGNKEETDIAMRVVADHLRAITFTIADGQLPGSTGPGYVIRRILRRAVRYASSKLGIKEPFMHELVDVLVREMADAFPELKAQQETVKAVIQEEEKSFLRTLEQGTKRFEAIVQGAASSSVSGEQAFELYDTYGFPFDLTQLMAAEAGMGVDKEGFEQQLAEQKKRSRADAASQTGDWTILNDSTEREFVGYDHLQQEARIQRYRKITDKKGDRYQLVLDRSPFYPEGGGQVGDTGVLVQGHDRVKVLDTVRENELAMLICERLPKDPAGMVIAQVDEHRRLLTRRNHSATHLMHHALREVLGAHVEQKGSLVAPDRLRFDLSHFAKITPQELEQIERQVNDMVRANITLDERRSIPITEAREMGAIALFGEKYGDQVRVIRFRDSMELCGGTHVPSTAEIGRFKIMGSSALAAGVRRIEAITSEAADAWIDAQLQELDALRARLNQPSDAVAALDQLIGREAALAREVEKANLAKVADLQRSLLNEAVQVNGYKLLAHVVDLDAQGMKDLSFRWKQQHDDLLAVLASEHDGKALLSVMVGDKLIREKGLDAKAIIKGLAAEIKGGGGGQPFFATAGGKDPAGIPRAIEKAKGLLG